MAKAVRVRVSPKAPDTEEMPDRPTGHPAFFRPPLAGAAFTAPAARRSRRTEIPSTILRSAVTSASSTTAPAGARSPRANACCCRPTSGIQGRYCATCRSRSWSGTGAGASSESALRRRCWAGPAGKRAAGRSHLVPWARLELARLSPLPPQDSVSTNFTTKARASIDDACGTFSASQGAHYNREFA